MRIIGNCEQPLIGESLLWLIARASELNFFCRAEVVKVFADKSETAFTSMKKIDPGTLEGLDLHAIKSFLLISEKNLAYSLFNFYKPSWIRRVDIYNPFHTHIRICPTCAKKGIHLFIHQIELWDKCLIHKHKLTNLCQECGQVLGDFLIKFDSRESTFNPYKCKFCNKSAINIHRTLSDYEINKIEKIFIEYAEWLKVIDNAITKIYLLDTLMKHSVSVRAMQNTRLICNAPNWLKQCLKVNNAHEELEYSIYNSALGSVSENVIGQYKHSKDFLIQLYANQLLITAEKYKSHLTKTFEITIKTMSDTVKLKTRLPQPRKHENYSIWCEALIYLEKYIGHFLKDFDQYLYMYSKGEVKWPNYSNPGLFEHFLDGPLRIITLDQRLRGQSLGHQMLNLWVNNHLYSLFCNYLGKIITQDLSKFWLYSNSGSLDAHMLSVEDGNNYFYYYDSDAIRFHISGKKRIDLADLLSIFKSGFLSTYGFEYSERKRQFIRKITTHCDLVLDEKEIISRALREGKRA